MSYTLKNVPIKVVKWQQHFPFLSLKYAIDSPGDVHVDICWRRLEGDNMCADPMHGRRTTFTECCCLYGLAWSGQCALCPGKETGEKQNFIRLWFPVKC